VTRVERAVLATSQARELCLALRRASIGPPALARLRSGGAASLRPADLLVALGLAWAAGDVDLVRATLAGLPADRIEADAVLLAYRDAAGVRPVKSAAGGGRTGRGPRPRPGR
jgi:hypothetical protein